MILFPSWCFVPLPVGRRNKVGVASRLFPFARLGVPHLVSERQGKDKSLNAIFTPQTMRVEGNENVGEKKREREKNKKNKTGHPKNN